MTQSMTVENPCFSFIVAPAYQKAWAAANAKFSYFSMTADRLHRVSSKGKWVVDGTIVTPSATFSWRVAVFRLSSDRGIGTALRYLRRVGK